MQNHHSCLLKLWCTYMGGEWFLPYSLGYGINHSQLLIIKLC